MLSAKMAVEWQLLLRPSVLLLYVTTALSVLHSTGGEHSTPQFDTPDGFTDPSVYKCGNFTLGVSLPKTKNDPVSPPLIFVFYSTSPETPIWKTAPDEPFVSITKGELETKQHSGTFIFDDKTEDLCSELVITKVTQVDDDTVMFSGTLCEAKVTTTWRSNTVAGFDQLTFDIQLLQSVKADEAYTHIFVTYHRESTEQFYGFGHQYTYFDLSGRKFPVFSSEQGVGRGLEPITDVLNHASPGTGGHWYTSYTHVPFYVTSDVHSMLVESPEYKVFDLTADDKVVIELVATQFKARLFVGDSMLDLISSATAYTGRMKPLPSWTQTGAVLGLEGGTETVLRDLEKLNPMTTDGVTGGGLPVSALWLQDWSGERDFKIADEEQRVGLWWNWEVDLTHYPGWEELIASLNLKGIRMLVYLNPMLVNISMRGTPFIHNYYVEAIEHGYAVRNPDGSLWSGYNDAIMVDLTNPNALEWMKQIIAKNVLSTRISGWMCDFAEALPLDAKLHNGSGSVLHNQYPTLWAKVNEDSIKENAADRADEIVYFMRSAGTFTSAHTSLFWMGDQLVTWDSFDGLRAAIISLQSASVSGHSMVHTDIGGYAAIDMSILMVKIHYIRSKELFMRWAEMAVFTLMFRTHLGTLPTQNWQAYSDQETIAHFTRMAMLFRVMASYREQLMSDAYKHGWPVIRHMVLEFPNNTKLKEAVIRYEQFMLGSEILVAPASQEGNSTVGVWLPAGTTWMHPWTKRVIHGQDGAVLLPAPIGQPCYLIRNNSSIQAALMEKLAVAGF